MNTNTYLKPPPRAWRWLALLIAAHLILGILFAALIPPLEKLDEYIHLEYVRYLQREGHLPDQRDQYIQDFPAEFHQPPLYYVPAALLTAPIPDSDPRMDWEPFNEFGFAFILSSIPDNANGTLHAPDNLAFPWKGDWLALYVNRFFSVLISAASLIPLFWLAWAVFQDEGLALGTVAWFAFRPSLLQINSTVSNDPLLLLTGTAVLAACALIIVRGPTWKQSIWLGILLGLTALTKFTWPATALAVPFAFVLAPGFRTDWKRRVGQFATAGGISVLLVGWWFIRNLVLYGDMSGIDLGGRADRPDFLPLRSTPPTWEEAGRVFWTTFRRYWAHFGVVGMPDWVNYALVGLTVLLVIGFLIVLFTRRMGRVCAHPRAAWFTLIVTGLYLGQIGALFMVNEHGGQVRYIYSGFAAMAILSQLGILGWFTLLKRDAEGITLLASLLPTVIMLPLTLYGLFGVLLPAYDLPQLVTDPALIADQYDQPADVQFGDTIRLIGFKVETPTVHPGEAAYVTLCWESGGPLDEAIPYSVNIVGEGDGKIGSRNTHPGLGMYATLYWEPGVYFCDRVRIPISDDAPSAETYRVILSYFHMDTLDTIPAEMADGTTQNLVTLGEIAVLPEDWPTAGETRYYVGDALAITGLEMQTAENLTLQIEWLALSDISSDYTAFIHVIDNETGQLAVQTDRRPQLPTVFWEEGAVIQQAINLDLHDIPPGNYRVLFGLYESTSVTRQTITTPDGAGLPDNMISLDVIEIR